MKYRRFGRTGIEVSELILGAGNVSGLYTGSDREAQRQLLRRALDGGINWIDTAFRYGKGKSEEALGILLKEMKEKPYISTKVGIEPDELNDIPGAIERNLKASLKRLRRKSVDIYQLHNRIGSKVDGRLIAVEHLLGKNGVAEGMRRMQEQGLCKFIGITALGETSAVHDVVRSGVFDTAQVYYNMLNPSAAHAMPPAWTGQNFDRLIEACREQDMGIIVIRAFAAGVLATDTRHGRESMITADTDLDMETKKAHAVFDLLGNGNGSRAQTALRFALSNPYISCVDTGVADLDQLEQALGASVLGELPDEAFRALGSLYKTNFER
ncbi:MAG: aldo/keto reductase [Rhodospirillales bacterium]